MLLIRVYCGCQKVRVVAKDFCSAVGITTRCQARSKLNEYHKVCNEHPHYLQNSGTYFYLLSECFNHLRGK